MSFLQKTGILIDVAMERVFEDVIEVLHRDSNSNQARANITMIRTDLIKETGERIMEIFDHNSTVNKRLCSNKGNVECLSLGRHQMVALIKEKSPESFNQKLMAGLINGEAP